MIRSWRHWFGPHAGDAKGVEEFTVARSVFLRLLGGIYALAFGSLLPQLSGLIGPGGIAPVDGFLRAVAEHVGVARFWYVPTIFWLPGLGAHPGVVAWAGMAVSLFVMAGEIPVIGLVLCWGFYLSLVSVGGPFLRFQWDALLLETGFIAIFLAPLSWRLKRGASPSRGIHFLFRWLAFRLMLGSGLVKLTSGDETWRSCTALLYHYETQPLPTWIGWWAHQAPAWFQHFSCVSMFAVELLAPFLIFAPRRWRHPAVVTMIVLQIVIALTGNYGFFNVLTVALLLLLIDDAAWRRVPGIRPGAPLLEGKAWPRAVIAAVVALIMSVSLPVFSGRFVPALVNSWAGIVYDLTEPFNLANPYGLFAVMTTRRLEITIEGSLDGRTWRAYEFRYKPQALDRAPRFVAPHMPRLDWQMWFAALGRAQDNRWFLDLVMKLLQGSPDVTHLLAVNPFADKPPQYVRAMIAEYHFTTRKERLATGHWWKKEESTIYCPPLSLRR